MLSLVFIVFLLIYFCVPYHDKLIFKNSGWLYFISHFQIFFIGIILMLFLFFFFMVCCFYSVFFYNSSFFFVSFLTLLFFLPHALDLVSYGLFGNSFFLEGFFLKNKNLLGRRKTSFYSFCNLYVRLFLLLISLSFFAFFYCFWLSFYVFFCWFFINNQKIDHLLPFLISNYSLVFIVVLIFFLPFMLEVFNYGLYNRSFFRKYSDF